MRLSNLGVDLEHVAFGIGKVNSAVSPGLVSRRLQDFHTLLNELLVTEIDLLGRDKKSNLYTR